MLTLSKDNRGRVVDLNFEINPFTKANVSLVWSGGRYQLFVFDGERQLAIHFDKGAQARIDLDMTNPPEDRVIPS